MRQIARKWGVAAESIEWFLESLFDFLVDRGLLVPVQLKGARGRPLPNVHGVYQVNTDRLRLNPNRGVKRCRSCRRTTTRDVPDDRCPAWRRSCSTIPLATRARLAARCEVRRST